MKFLIASILVLSSFISKASSNVADTTKPVYYCNAITKAGSPCKHRVKNKGERCYQHQGKIARTIIKQSVDKRGLISVVFTEGVDTFALDHMNRMEFERYFRTKAIN